MMVDEIYDRGYQSGRAELNAGLDRAFARLASTVSESFTALNRIQFDAPWKAKPKDAGCA